MSVRQEKGARVEKVRILLGWLKFSGEANMISNALDVELVRD